uniref:NMDA-type glutamate receptor subunit 1, variant 9 (NR1.9) n=1 Tax=Apis mellifera carnica TaxID=88217 RepID=Q4QYZ0_APICA|nr:NMDA-type glutamate receptor subunit 1, variant 9 (NR1.9) [Apis mellifera carnica]
MKYESIALFISLIILNDEIYNIIASPQLNNPTLFMIGGVFSNNKSKKYFEHGQEIVISVNVLFLVQMISDYHQLHIQQTSHISLYNQTNFYLNLLITCIS